jgi:hypothetical protein
MRIVVQAALQVAAIMTSMSIGAAEIAPRIAEQPTGDFWDIRGGNARGITCRGITCR